MKKIAKFIVNGIDHSESDSIVAGSYDNVPVMLYVMGFKPGLSGGRCEKL